MKKETGIIMSGDHPQLILDRLKTQTRRVIKPQPTDGGLKFATACGGEFYAWQDDWLNLDEYSEDGGPCQRLCPYGQVGDFLWVRETWRTFRIYDHYKPSDITPTGTIEYKTNPQPKRAYLFGKWRPSIFMPKWAARIWLEITEVRVAWLRSISPADALAEGGYTVDEFIELYLRINNLSEDADPWDWVLSFKEAQR